MADSEVQWKSHRLRLVDNGDGTYSFSTSGAGGGAGDASASNQDEQTALLTTIDADTGSIASDATAAVALLTTMDADTSYLPGMDADTSLLAAATQAIDTAVGSSDRGVVIVGVRDDALSTLTPTEGDAVPFRFNESGAQWTIEAGAWSDATDSVKAVPGIPDGATYFKYGARIVADGASEVKACPSGGYIVVTNVRVRSITSTDASVVLYFDTNNDQSTFDNGVDEIVEDVQLPSSADSMPGSNSGPIFQVGQVDDDLRVDVVGDVTLIVEGYTVPA